MMDKFLMVTLSALAVGFLVAMVFGVYDISEKRTAKINFNNGQCYSYCEGKEFVVKGTLCHCFGKTTDLAKENKNE